MGGRGGKGSSGPRAAWERRLQAAELQAAALRLPRQADAKPLALAPALDVAVARLGQQPWEGTPQQQADVRAAARHLGRAAAGLDASAEASACLLSWGLLLRAARWLDARTRDSTCLHPSTCAALLEAAGWQGLLREALPWLPRWPAFVGETWRQLSDAALREDAVARLACQLVAALGRGGASAGVEEELQLLQTLLLEWGIPGPGSAGGDGGGGCTGPALRRLLAAVEARLAPALAAMRGEGPPGAAPLPPWLFQQLCQLRARLVLGSGAGPQRGAAPAQGRPLAAPLPSEAEQLRGDPWEALLLVRGTAAPVAEGPPCGPGMDPPHLDLFLGAKAAMEAVASVQLPPGGSSPCDDAGPDPAEPGGSDAGSGGGGGGNGGAASPQSVLPYRASVGALPGVVFPPPSALPQHRGDTSSDPLASDPNPLSPGRIALQLAAMMQQAAAAAEEAPEEAAQGGGLTLGHPAAALPALARLLAGAAARVADASVGRHLLGALLLSPRYAALRRALAADGGLQHRARRALVAVSNRMLAESGEGAAVWGQERQRVAAAVAALLPHALLCPEAAVRQLVRDAAQHSGQVGLLVDVAREVAPLAAFRAAPSEPPALLNHLCLHLRQPGLEAAAAASLARFAAALCKPPAPGEAPLLSAAALLRAAVLPALEERGDPYRLEHALRLAAALPGREPRPPAAATVPGSPAPLGGGGGWEGLEERLALGCLRLLDFGARRIDLTADGLRAPLAVWQLADQLTAWYLGALGRRPDGGTAAARRIISAPGAPGCAQAYCLAAGLALKPLPPRAVRAPPVQGAAVTPPVGDAAAALLSLFTACAASEGAAAAALATCLPGSNPTDPHGVGVLLRDAAAGRPLPVLRQALVAAAAVLLPCCAPTEARRVLLSSLPAVIMTALGGQAAAVPSSGAAPAAPPAVLAAAIESACRALHALALAPGLAPLEGETPTAAAGPGLLRRVAVERTMRHVSTACQAALLACPASPAPAGGGAPPGADPAAQLASRCFREVAACAAAVQAHYACATLQVCLLELLKEALERAPAGERGAVAAELEAAAAGLAGGLRETVLFALDAG